MNHPETDRPNLSASTPAEDREEELFVLLSCYVDGEVTEAERQEAERLLACDPEARAIYEQLSCLSAGVQLLPVPPSSQSADEVVSGTFAKMRHRRQLRLAWGGSAIAALFVAAVSGLQLDFGTRSPQIAQSPAPVSQSLDRAPAPTVAPPAESEVPTPDPLDADRLESRALFVE